MAKVDILEVEIAQLVAWKGITSAKDVRARDDRFAKCVGRMTPEQIAQYHANKSAVLVKVLDEVDRLRMARFEADLKLANTVQERVAWYFERYAPSVDGQISYATRIATLAKIITDVAYYEALEAGVEPRLRRRAEIRELQRRASECLGLQRRAAEEAAALKASIAAADRTLARLREGGSAVTPPSESDMLGITLGEVGEDDAMPEQRPSALPAIDYADLSEE